MSLHVELVSVEREVWSGEADSVVARTDSDPDAFQSQLNRLTAIMRRLV